MDTHKQRTMVTLCGKGCEGASRGSERTHSPRGGSARVSFRGQVELTRQMAGDGSPGTQSHEGVGAGRAVGKAWGSPAFKPVLLSVLAFI